VAPHGQARGAARPEEYDQLATYEPLLVLVAQHRLDARHSGLARAAHFLLGFQTDKGDLRGVYASQYTPNYTVAILAVLIEAGCTDDPRIDAGMRWLLSMRQDDGGWTIPHRTLHTPQTRSSDRVMQLPHPLAPARSRPFSHLVTGIVVRAFAAHPRHRTLPETHAACALLRRASSSPTATLTAAPRATGRSCATRSAEPTSSPRSTRSPSSAPATTNPRSRARSRG